MSAIAKASPRPAPAAAAKAAVPTPAKAPSAQAAAAPTWWDPGDGWFHATLQSAESSPAQISVDFQAYSTHTPDFSEVDTFANNIWVNVQRQDLGADDKLRAVWITDLGIDGGGAKVQQQDLTYAGEGRFTAPLNDTDIAHGTNDGYTWGSHQQVAIVANGDWLTDPVSGSHNFTMYMDKIVDPNFYSGD